MIGRSVRRREDPRYISGSALYADDMHLESMLWMTVIRSPIASGQITRLNLSEAKAAPGVIEAWSACDLGRDNEEFPVFQLRPHPGLFAAINHSALAERFVRYVGEPIAVLFAEDAAQAIDAAEMVELDLEPLQPVTTMSAATAEGAMQVHEGAPDNVAGAYEQGVGDVATAFSQAEVVIRRSLRIDRGAAHPIEPRSLVAYYSDAVLTVWVGTQVPHRLKEFLSARLGLTPDRVRIIAPDTGGSFGVKAYPYAEDFLAARGSVKLGRPVKWVEGRREHVLSTFPERSQEFEAALALDREGRIRALDVFFDHELGAYCTYGFAVPQNTANHLMGPYRIPVVRVRWRAVYTNVTPAATYRGAGRPQATFVIERLIDAAALAMDIDPLEVRLRNLIPPAESYDSGVDSAVGRIVYDSGDYEACMKRAASELGYSDWRSRQQAARADGRLIGIGIANFVELSVTFPFEGAVVAIEDDGTVRVATGASQQGHGYETILAQIVADVLEIDIEQIEVETGDTNAIEKGAGNYGSRVTIMAGSAANLAAHEIRRRALDLASQLLGASIADLKWVNGTISVRASPSNYRRLSELAAIADPPLIETVYFETAGFHVSNGTHLAVVEIAPETRELRFLRYVVVHDCGRMINPMLVESQILGGLVQGLGGALIERLAYDEEGQPMTTGFLNYLLPTASWVPTVELHHRETPSKNNPLGAKGAGEGGIIPVYALVASAVEDALGVPVDEMPLSTETIWRLAAAATGTGARSGEPGTWRR